ncbi:hypothetical protein FF1_029374 [Malus domestica]
MTFNMHIGYLEAIVRDAHLCHHIQPKSSTPDDELDERNYRICNLINFFISKSVDSFIVWRCKWKEIDTGLPVPDRALLVVVRLARAASPGSEEIEEAIKLIRLEEDIQVDIWVLVESGHDVDAADLRVQISSAAVFLSLSRRI